MNDSRNNGRTTRWTRAGRSALALGLAALAGMAHLPAARAQAGDFVVGVTAAMTGPAAATYAPVIEAMRAYVNHLNGRGGVDGRPIRLVVLDDSGEPSKAAANAKRLTTQDNAVLLLNSSLSSTYAPVVGEARRARIPLWFAGSACPKETYPPQPDPLQFCSTAFGAGYDSRMALGFIKDAAKAPVRLGFSAMAIPLSRTEIDYAEGEAKTLGMTTTEKQVIPPPTADYTPFATKIKEQGANWVYAWAPWVTQIRTLDSLRKLGWDGDYVAFAHINAEDELNRVRDPRFYVFGANALFQDDLPIHAEMRTVTHRANLNYPVTQLTEGFVAALILEGIVKAAGPKATPDKVLAAMNGLKVDTRGLRGGPVEWTKDNHFRARQYYRVYRFSPEKGAIERVKDWTAFDVR